MNEFEILSEINTGRGLIPAGFVIINYKIKTKDKILTLELRDLYNKKVKYYIDNNIWQEQILINNIKEL